MDKAFATLEEFRASHPDLDGVEDATVTRRLLEASVTIAALCANAGVDTSKLDSDLLSMVACSAAARALQSGDLAGVKQESWGASPYSGSVTYANPTGDLYLTSTEKGLLGIIGDDMTVTAVNPEPASWSDRDVYADTDFAGEGA